MLHDVRTNDAVSVTDDAFTTSAKSRAAKVLPAPVVVALDELIGKWRRARIRFVQWLFGLFGYNVAKKGDYYSTLPVLREIKATRERWDRPSELSGLNIDVARMTERFARLSRWDDDYRAATGSYRENVLKGFGPGYPVFDARTLYFMLREHKPARYLEVGSGLSTFYASLAANRNADDGRPMKLTSIEPYPYDALTSLPGLELIQSFVQDVPTSRFEELEAGDVLFIDSSHALKIGSDVQYLFLEVLPRIARGVLVHIHDVPFPYNTPFPADTWLFGERWPVYWNEAMIVQAFLAFNNAFEVELSVPMLRHVDESILTSRFADYVPLADEWNPPSALWLRRVA